jgi:folylpolyglutamate synthase/dihydrofolate synthase
LLGNPQNNYQTVHISGTNGKGSTSQFISHVITKHYQANQSEPSLVGAFNSPHLLHEKDAIRINLQIISDAIYSRALMIVSDLNRMNKINASPFEITTAVAFLAFSLSKVKIAIIEVGLGGTLDATNVLPPPLVCVVCNIGIDHVEFLGTEVLQIAGHKIGIVKRGVGKCIVSEQDYKEVIPFFQSVCDELEVEVKFPRRAIRSGNDVDVFFDGKILHLKHILQGDFQLSNVSAACECLSYLKTHGFDIQPNEVIGGLQETRIPGRLQTIETKYGKLLLDGAHNTLGIKNLKNHVKDYGKIYYICGFSGKRDSKSFLDLLVRPIDRVSFVSFKQPEGMPWITCQDPKQLTLTFMSDSRVRTPIDSGGSLLTALAVIKDLQGYEVVVFGSLYLVAEVYRCLNITDY